MFDSDAGMRVYNEQPAAEDEKDSVVKFSVRPVEVRVRNEKGEETGEIIWKDREFITLVKKGNRLNSFDGYVTPEYVGRFKNAYAAFKAGRELAKTGTPLEEWPLISSASQCMQWKAIGLFSVEDLAGIGDENIGNLGTGGMTWRDKAKLWLKARKDGQATAKAASDNVEKDREIVRLKGQLADLAAKVEALAGISGPQEMPQRRKTLSPDL